MKKLLPWLVVLVIMIVGFGTIFATVQQAQRSEANSPQIQLAQDAASTLNKGGQTFSVIENRVEIDKSLAPFTNVYDKKGNVVIGSGYLDGKVPKVPKGILEDSRGKAYHAVTWEAKDGVRIAAIVVEGKDYYVLSGRNIKEVEKNEAKTLQIVLFGWIVAAGLLGVVFVLSGIAEEY